LRLKILKKLRTTSLNSEFSVSYIAYLHDQNKSGFFGGPTFIQPIRAILKVFKKP